MDIKNNNEFDLFAGLPKYNAILNWFAESDPDVKQAILTLQSKLTKKQIEKCKKGKDFESETETSSISLGLYGNDKEELEVDWEGEEGDCLLNLNLLMQQDLCEMQEESVVRKQIEELGMTVFYPLASIDITDYVTDTETEYEASLHKIDGELYVFLTKSYSNEEHELCEDKNIIKKRIPAEELEAYFNQNTKNL